MREKYGYELIESNNEFSEKVYSIRRYKEFINTEKDHKIKLWKMHGDYDVVPSVMLGFDQYCGSISKLSNYIKGEYTFDKEEKKHLECRTKIIDKCKSNDFDGISWVELFFNSNLFIVGFGMAFSEIDLWWIINQRARIIKTYPDIIKNEVHFLYNRYDFHKECKAIRTILEKFGVTCHKIRLGKHYLNSIFKYVYSINNELCKHHVIK